MLSIIIPTLNEEKTLERTLLCLKGLTLHDNEIIISDGKSTDKTVEIAKKYNAKIVEYTDSVRQTIGQARNMGADVAQGEYLIFIDADIIIPEINSFFIKAVKNFEQDKDLVALAPFIYYYKKEATFADNFFGGIMNYIYYISNNFFHIGQSAGEFQIIQKDIFKKLNGYNEKLSAAEDIDMFSRLSKIGRTKVDRNLKIFQSPRRPHQVGWPRLLSSWFRNAMSSKLFKKSCDKEWEVIR